MFETTRWRLTLAIVVVEGAFFTTSTLALFFTNLTQGNPSRALEDLQGLVALFFLIWACGFVVATYGPVVGVTGIALRLAYMVLVFFTLVGAAGTMLFLLPTTFLLLVSAATKRVPAVR